MKININDKTASINVSTVRGCTATDLSEIFKNSILNMDPIKKREQILIDIQSIIIKILIPDFMRIQKI
jgi:hypothetical protein